MPIIEAKILAGRTQAQKAAFARRVTEVAVETLDADPAAVRVIITETAPNHWFVAGAAKGDPPK